jgi:pimeloyl-ACP methyl ester carboxylesterase
MRAPQGVSGGGPYALACASALPPSKLKSVLIICGLGPPDIGTRGMNIMHRVAFSFGWRIVPTAIVRWYFGREPAGRLDLSDAERLSRLLEQNKRLTHPKDIEILTDVDILKLQLRGLREAYSQGFNGTRQDGKLMTSDWGFRIEDIRPDLPFQLWYGKDDNFVPLNHGKQIAARLGDRAQLRVEDDTHASIYFRWRREALEGLLASM